MSRPSLPGELNDAFSIFGRVAVVTGAASGIGRETARTFALAGAIVVALDLNETMLEETRKLIEDIGGTVLALLVDVSRREDVESAAAQTADRFGNLDIWVNCAGISFMHGILEIDDAQAHRTIAVNMLGPLWGVEAAGRIMVERGRGVILNVASEGGERAVPGLSVYGMTKAAVISLTKTAARELGPSGVRVNAIAPGWVDTPMAQVLYTDEHGKIDTTRRETLLVEMASHSSLGQVGRPSDMAQALLYLAADASRNVSGQVLTINGGST